MICAYCQQRLGVGEFVVRLVPVAIAPGRRTGQPTPENDYFPDGCDEKYLHIECMDFAMQQSLGLDGVGYDDGLHRLQEGDPRGSPGPASPGCVPSHAEYPRP